MDRHGYLTRPEPLPSARSLRPSGIRIPAGAHSDARGWAEDVFDITNSPAPVRVLMAIRQVLVPIIGVEPSSPSPFAVREVVDGEAMLAASERHLDFWCGVRTTSDALEVTTAVSLHGWRGRLYWLPVGLLHGPVLRAMMRRAVRRTGQSPAPHEPNQGS